MEQKFELIAKTFMGLEPVLVTHRYQNIEAHQSLYGKKC